ncbi:FadR/GntR family transcriptional regulator [Roseovarius dicentrarchi]|uniref:FadR/GntR family transcriptional regulator n=1 Tax=Roseovarius dicentrarchi TaxID=2250573 RepID=UPI000DEA5410|nr:FadR/GntR family transcriptional regulator [Roseovarius dicentrarchi]
MTENNRISADLPRGRLQRRSGHLPEEIAKDLIEGIASGSLPVGARLPSERDLCAHYLVSRAVVREALSQLKSDGLVAARAGSGVYVIEQDATNAFRFQNFSVSNLTSLQEAMELLIPIEVAATRIAARRRNAEDLKKIRRALVGMEYAIASDQLGDEEDYAFHQAIVEATHNQHFISLCKHLEASARNIIRQARNNTRVHHENLLEAVQEEHKAIFEELKNGDEAAAAKAAERHLVNAGSRIQLYLDVM